MADKLQTMKVRATETFWERHPQHPEGEVFLSKGEEGIVAETPEALTAVGRGKLVRLSQESSERKSSSKSTGAGTLAGRLPFRGLLAETNKFSASYRSQSFRGFSYNPLFAF